MQGANQIVSDMYHHVHASTSTHGTNATQGLLSLYIAQNFWVYVNFIFWQQFAFIRKHTKYDSKK